MVIAFGMVVLFSYTHTKQGGYGSFLVDPIHIIKPPPSKASATMAMATPITTELFVDGPPTGTGVDVKAGVDNGASVCGRADGLVAVAVVVAVIPGVDVSVGVGVCCGMPIFTNSFSPG